jgi:hypothetical protein
MPAETRSAQAIKGTERHLTTGPHARMPELRSDVGTALAALGAKRALRPPGC